MSQLLTCPFCKFSKHVPIEKLPRQQVTVTCPKCRQRFIYDPPSSPVQTAVIGNDAPPPTIQAVRRETAPPHAKATPVPAVLTKSRSWASIDLKDLNGKHKAVVAGFIFAVFCLVGLRLWADGKARDVPFPNMIASKADQLAITWGESILVHDRSGKRMATIDMPPDTEIAHLTYDGEGNLWLGDHRTKQIFRLQSGQWVPVVNGAGTIRGTFKFVQYPPTGEIFVTDTTNHRILVYSAKGKFLHSFAKEGRGDGEFMFPNEIVLRDSDLLIVNTNAGRIDLFSRDGQFLRTLVKSVKDGRYQFPTLMTWLDGGRFAYLLTVDLNKAKVIVCDSEGNRQGEFITPLPLREVGNITFANGKAIITDIGNRQIYTFDPTSLSYSGPFSQELVDRAAHENMHESRFKNIGRGALIVLLVMCIGVGIAFYRSQRRNVVEAAKGTAASVPDDPAILWGVPADKRQLVPIMVCLVTTIVIKAGVHTQKISNPTMIIVLLILMLALFVVMIRSIMASGLVNGALIERLRQVWQAAWPKIAAILVAGEEVIGCTTVRTSRWVRKGALLVLTDRRLLVGHVGLELLPGSITQIESIPYTTMARLQLAHTRLSSGWASRLLKTEEFELTVEQQTGGKSLIFIGQNKEILEKVKSTIEAQLLKTIEAATMHDAGIKPAPKEPVGPAWKPAFLSAIYPGLGQFHNRQIFKGSILAVMFTVEAYVLTGPALKLVDHSAELRQQDMPILVMLCISIMMTWVLAVSDAWRTAKSQ